MPVYEYTCDNCGTTTEALRKMADADTPQPCDACGSTKTHRKHSVFTTGGGVPLPVGGAGGGSGGGCGCGNPHGPCNMG